MPDDIAPDTSPGYEMRRRLIQIIAGDSRVQKYLFPSWAPAKLNSYDTRVYSAHSNLRDEQLLQMLPRVLVETRTETNDWEQPDFNTHSAPVAVWIHCLVPRDQEGTGELLDSRIQTLIASTYLTDARIIASELVPTGQRQVVPERAFNDAWRFTTQYRAANVGVIVDE